MIAEMSFGNVGIPVAVLLGMHGMLGALPIVEATDDGHSLGMRRPHAKANLARMRNGSHALEFRIAAHVFFLSFSKLFPGRR